ncbi:Yip1-like protein [Hasllibacter halocynthiae]|uniref:Yip1-like protein n=1 Tax=Hasllibacter halocynthiae TaxID=595589 RepID=A0A2T0X8Q0_9RHOB|nr:YIP1 family protein [Hasllibacter halocynthiae]PRY95244.1 Yip1-like protein [Hasllibacter halocynthiae]
MALRQLLPLAGLSVRDPRAGMRGVLDLGLPVQHYWTAFLAVITLAAILVQGFFLLAPLPETVTAPDGTEAPLVLPNGLQTAAFVGGGLLLAAAVIHGLSRAAGGTGRFAEQTLALTWLQAIQIGLGLVALPVLVLLPGLAPLLEVAVFALVLWMLAGFTAVVQDFPSVGKVVVALVVGFFGLVLILSILLTALGLAAGGAVS